MNRVCRIAVTAILVAVLPVMAQSPAPEPANLRGDSQQTRKRLEEAEQQLTAGQIAEAIDALQRIMDEAGDDFIRIDGKRYQTARQFAHQILSRLPADSLKGYQDRLEEPARKLLARARKMRDPAPLWRLLDQYFVSRPSQEGSLLLGELLFERGDFRAAERIWRQLLPDGDTELSYPGPVTDPADIRARVLLARIFQGKVTEAKEELAAFRARYPEAKGTFAGRDGPYADTLQAFLDSPPNVPLAANSGINWPTYGGGPERSGRLGVRLPDYWPAGRPNWVKELPQFRRHPAAPTLPPIRPPFGYPIIANGRVFVTDGASVFGFELATGQALPPVRLGPPPGLGFDLEKPPPDASMGLTAAGDRLYVRIGPPTIQHLATPRGKAVETAIVCLGPGAADDLSEYWRVRPPGDAKTPAMWEGAPLVAGRRMWAAYARFDGGRVTHGIACYDPADSTVTPAGPAWDVEVCDSPVSSAADPRARQELLTLAGRNVVFCSNTGAVVAVDAVSGKRVWGFRYARERNPDASRSPDASPAVYSAGRVFVAPVDSNRVYAFDPDTGELLWESGPVEGASIIGVAAGKVIVSVAGPARGLRGLSIETGSHRDPDGWVIHEGGGLLSYGQGFVTDDAVLWPTRAGLFFIRPSDGSLLGPPLMNHLGGVAARFFGHLAFADGVFVVVTPTEIWSYLTDGKRFGVPNVSAVPNAAHSRFRELTRMAERALAAGDSAKARESLIAATAADFPASHRAWAAARLLLLYPCTNPQHELPANVRAAITADIRDEWLLSPNGLPVTLAMLQQNQTERVPPPSIPPSSPVPDAGRKPQAVPELSEDVDITRTLRLPVGSVPLGRLPEMDCVSRRLFVAVAEANELLAITLDTAITTRHHATDRFTHIAETASGFVAVGPQAVAIYSEEKAAQWVFRVPTMRRLPATPGEYQVQTDTEPALPELSSFRLTGPWLVARLGLRHLIALDLQSRRVAWVLGANGQPGFQPHEFPESAHFGPEFLLSGNLIVAQSSFGRRWFIRVETGKVLNSSGFNHATSWSWWASAPMPIAPGNLIIADGPGLIRKLDLTTGRISWTHKIIGEASLSGEPPQIRSLADSVLVAVRRNHGIEVERLHSKDGRSMWPDGPAFLDGDRIRFANADTDDEMLYVPAGNMLAALSIKNGQTEWEVELPNTQNAAQWVVRAGTDCLIVYPDAAIPREPIADVLARITRSFRKSPRVSRLPALAAGLYDAWVVRSFPVLVFDKSGERLATFELPAAGPAISVWFAKNSVVAATGDRIVWLR